MLLLRPCCFQLQQSISDPTGDDQMILPAAEQQVQPDLLVVILKKNQTNRHHKYARRNDSLLLVLHMHHSVLFNVYLFFHVGLVLSRTLSQLRKHF